MKGCDWSVGGCHQGVLTDPEGHCYYHGKVRDGLITATRVWSPTETATILLPPGLQNEADRRRSDYFARLVERFG